MEQPWILITSYKIKNNLKFLERNTIEGDSPVRESFLSRVSYKVRQDTRNLVGRREDHLPRLNTS